MYKNRVEVVVKNKAGEVLHSFGKDNVISDDFLAQSGHIFTNNALSGVSISNSTPYCFLLPDGAAWTSFTWDRTNPWAPYTATLGNSLNPSANPLYLGLSKSGYPSSGNLTPPSQGNGNRWRMFYSWSQLPNDLQLKAIGLTGMQNDNFAGTLFGLPGNGVASNFVPETLVILPSSILVHGLIGATNIPDVLEISYYISVIGAS